MVGAEAGATVSIAAKRTLKVEKLARIYDDEIAPYWGARFGKLLLRDLAMPARCQVLDVSCGTGEPTLELLRRMPEGSRLIAIDESSAMLDVVRKKVAQLGGYGSNGQGGKVGVFLRSESAVPKLSFADEVYDLVVCNLGLPEMPCIESALGDFARVAKAGGEVRCTLPLAGTFDEFHDLYREVLVKHDKHEALDRLEHHIARYPTFERAEACLAAAQLTGSVEVEEFSLLFRSSREFFFAPVIEYGPLNAWKAIAGGGQEMQDVFWYIKEAIDAYFAGRPFTVTVRAGCVIGKKPERCERRPAAVPPPPPIAAFDTEECSFDDIETGMPWPSYAIAAGSVRAVRVDDPDDGIELLASIDVALDEALDDELDAFADGAHRPDHLVD
jgi:ubiquinone/menaquinone biosynthesis C-methylase UbiE